MPVFDLSADLGEGFGTWSMGDDAQLLGIVSSANIACGFHAGDPLIMDQTVRLCRENGVAIGAHPSFPDLRGFGRRTMNLTVDEIRTDVLYQVGALSAFAAVHGVTLSHVSPHGRLGNLVVVDEHYAAPVVDAVASFDPDLVVLTQAGLLADLARARGLTVGLMGFPDRAYNDDGTLVSRAEPGAIIHDPEEVVARAVTLACEGTVTTRTGTVIGVDCHTILLHGDNPGSVDVARRVRAALESAGVTLAPLREVLAHRAAGRT